MKKMKLKNQLNAQFYIVVILLKKDKDLNIEAIVHQTKITNLVIII